MKILSISKLTRTLKKKNIIFNNLKFNECLQ